MALSNEQVKGYIKRLLLSRMRILANNGFYGLLLMHMKYSLDDSCDTAYTDGERIAFSPAFMDELTDVELDFVMMHEILHVALRHCKRTGNRDPFLFNIACDIVVNSNILRSNDGNVKTITLKKYGESMHLAPTKEEGHLFTAEEVYEMLLKKAKKKKSENGEGDSSSDGNGSGQSNSQGNRRQNGRGNGTSSAQEEGWDDHSRWKEGDDDDSYEDDLWVARIKNAAEASEIREAATSCGKTPVFATRLLKELQEGQIDWRVILQNFIQEEINDYSFSPPDRRLDDSPFYLPDFNEKDELVKNVWFVIDTSGSMSDKAVTAAYSEICSAIEAFNGHLEGYVSFMEAGITEPVPFSDVEELMDIKPVGSGGTDFSSIFKYLDKYLSEEPPSYIVIITDGYDVFPKEERAQGIPVLWLINNDKITPPWGKVARIKL